LRRLNGVIFLHKLMREPARNIINSDWGG